MPPHLEPMHLTHATSPLLPPSQALLNPQVPVCYCHQGTSSSHPPGVPPGPLLRPPGHMLQPPTLSATRAPATATGAYATATHLESHQSPCCGHRGIRQAGADAGECAWWGCEGWAGGQAQAAAAHATAVSRVHQLVQAGGGEALVNHVVADVPDLRVGKHSRGRGRKVMSAGADTLCLHRVRGGHSTGGGGGR